jgi:hypothetical protein
MARTPTEENAPYSSRELRRRRMAVFASIGPLIFTIIFILAILGGIWAAIDWMLSRGWAGKLMSVLITLAAVAILDLLDWSDALSEKAGIRFWTINLILLYLGIVALRVLAAIFRGVRFVFGSDGSGDARPFKGKGRIVNHLSDPYSIRENDSAAEAIAKQGMNLEYFADSRDR